MIILCLYVTHQSQQYLSLRHNLQFSLFSFCSAIFASQFGNIVANPATNAFLAARNAAHEFDGFGGLSAGASSRLLWDYPEEQREDILDFLFKPNFGASLSINKVEIGGSTASTDGSEPAISFDGENWVCSRGYENWLLSESKKRNPNIKTYGLSWGVPLWVANGTGSYYTEENINFHIKWLQCVRDTVQVDVDYIGVWNERSVTVGDLDWVVRFRNAMDQAGFESTKIVIPDGHGAPTDLVQAMAQNATQRNAVDAIGLHYPCNEPLPEANAIGLSMWASEDYSSSSAEWESGGALWGRLLVQNYVRMNMTATIAWATIWSVYGNLVCETAGLTRADEPWSGHYEVDTPIWTSAQIGQFVAPGWWFLGVASSGSGELEGGGAYVTLIDNKTNPTQFVVIAESLGTSGARCEPTKVATGNQTLHLTLDPSLPRPGTQGMALWLSTSMDPFQLWQTGLQPQYNSSGFGSISITIPPNAIWTLTSHPGNQSHGNPTNPIPPSARFPLPYNASFETPGAPGTYNTLLPMFVSDMTGSWERHNSIPPPPSADPSAAGEWSLVQMVPANPGPVSWVGNADPMAMVGDVAWGDMQASVWVFLPTQSERVGGSAGAVEMQPCVVSSSPFMPFQQWMNNTPAMGFLENKGASVCLNEDGCGGAGSGVITWQCVTSGNTCPNAGTKNLQWWLDTNTMQLHSALNNLCVTPTGSSLEITNCSTSTPIPQSQQWSLDSSTMQLRNTESGMCVGTPLPRVYVQLCTRIEALNGFKQTISTLCLRANQTSASLLLFLDASSSGFTTLATYPLSRTSWQPVAGGAWIQLGLRVVGNSAIPFINSSPLPTVTNTSIPVNGNIGLGCGWHKCAFDILEVKRA